MHDIAVSTIPLLADPPLAPAARAIRSVGRPRDPRVDAAVLDATRRLLVEVGYEHLSIEAVARRAGVHRPAVYRRWRSKVELVHDAVYPSSDSTFQVPDTGDFDRDLRTVVRNTVAIFSRAEVRAAVPGLLAAMRADPEVGRALAPRLEAGARAEFSRWLAGAVRRGEAKPLVSPNTMLDLLAGTVLFRMRSSGVEALGNLEDDLVTLLRHAVGGPPARRKRPATRTRSVARARGRR